MLDPAKAQAMGIRPGKAFAELKAGLAVQTAEGRVVQASEVCRMQGHLDVNCLTGRPAASSLCLLCSTLTCSLESCILRLPQPRHA